MSENMCVSVSVQVCVCIYVFMNYILITFVLEQFGFGKQKVSFALFGWKSHAVLDGGACKQNNNTGYLYHLLHAIKT